MPNIQHVKDAIAVMERAKLHEQNFDMRGFQCNHTELVRTEEQLHTCGNTACFAGYLALSQEWRDAGGTVVSSSGEPKLGPYYAGDAIAIYLGISSNLARALIYFNLTPFSFYPVPFNKVKPQHVIDKLNLILEGKLS